MYLRRAGRAWSQCISAIDAGLESVSVTTHDGLPFDDARVIGALDRQPALSAAQPDRAVLGRQRHRRPLRGWPHPAGDALVPALERRIPAGAAVRLAAPEP